MMQQHNLSGGVEILSHAKYEADGATPLYIFFPGIGEAGTAGRKIDLLYRHGFPYHLRPGTSWSPLGVFVAVFAPSAFPKPATVNTIIDEVLALFPGVDSNHINLVALSAGAETIVEYIMADDAYAERIANAIIMSVTESPMTQYLNGGEAKKKRLESVRLWFLHGTIDPKPHSIAPVRKAVALMKERGKEDVWLTEFKGAGHNIPWNKVSSPTWRSPGGNSHYSWCRGHKRKTK